MGLRDAGASASRFAAGRNLEVFDGVADRQQAVADLAYGALRGGAPALFMREVVGRVGEILGADACGVFERVDGGRLLLRAGVGWPEGLVGAATVGAGSLAGYALNAKDPMVPEEPREEERFGEQSWLARGAASAAAVRIEAGGEVFGVLGVYSASAGSFRKEDVLFLQNIAEVLGMAIERARRTSAAEERFAFLSEVACVLASVPDLASALAAAARAAVPALADWCFVDLVHEEDGAPVEIRRLVVAGNLESQERRHLAEDLGYRHYPMTPDSPHGTPRVLRTGRPELLPTVGDRVLQTIARDEEHLRVMRRLDPASYMCVPLQVGRRLIGALGLVSTGSGRRYDEEDLALAEGLSRCVALFVRGTAEDLQAGRELRESGGLRRQNGGVISSVPIARPPALTPRQREVLALLDAGLPARQIGAQLVVAETTVRKHIRDLLKAFGAHSQREALFKARSLGLLDD